jgi:hypothetical protein
VAASQELPPATNLVFAPHAGGAAVERVTPKHVAMSWMQRLRRVFAIEIEQCRRCGGRLEVMASIEDAVLIERILTRVRQRDEEDRLLPLGARGLPPSLL